MQSTKRKLSFTPKKNTPKKKRNLGKSIPVSTIGRAIGQTGFPSQMVVKLRYGDVVQLDPATGTPQTYIWSANGCWDPDVTNVGHQPRGFDNLMALYKYYVVLGSKMKCQFTSNSSTSTIDTLVSLTTSNTAAAPSGLIAQLEQPTGNLGQNVKLFSAATEPHELSQTFSHKQWFSKDKYDPAFAGTSSQNPGEGVFYCLAAQGSGASDNPAAIDFAVQIDYTVLFYDPVQPSQS